MAQLLMSMYRYPGKIVDALAMHTARVYPEYAMDHLRLSEDVVAALLAPPPWPPAAMLLASYDRLGKLPQDHCWCPSSRSGVDEVDGGASTCNSRSRTLKSTARRSKSDPRLVFRCSLHQRTNLENLPLALLGAWGKRSLS